MNISASSGQWAVGSGPWAVRFTRARRWFQIAGCLLPAACCPLAHAAPTQEEVFRSINQSVGQSVDPTKLLAVVLCVVGLIIVLALLSHRRQRVVVPRALNHQGKLLREVARGVNLKPVEIKQLKTLSEQQELASPLVLLLCPSLLAKAAKAAPDRVDPRALASLTQKLSNKRSLTTG